MIRQCEMTESQIRILEKLCKDRLRYLRQAVRRLGRETNELQKKKIETIAIIQTLKGG